ncbi:MAG: hypothetical protein ACRC2S_08875 [Waterburya sp.]
MLNNHSNQILPERSLPLVGLLFSQLSLLLPGFGGSIPRSDNLLPRLNYTE